MDTSVTLTGTGTTVTTCSHESLVVNCHAWMLICCTKTCYFLFPCRFRVKKGQLHVIRHTAWLCDMQVASSHFMSRKQIVCPTISFLVRKWNLLKRGLRSTCKSLIGPKFSSGPSTICGRVLWTSYKCQIHLCARWYNSLYLSAISREFLLFIWWCFGKSNFEFSAALCTHHFQRSVCLAH